MIDTCEFCPKPKEKVVLLELRDIHSNIEAKFKAGIGVLVKALGYDSERQQKEISPFKSVRDLERLSKSRVESNLLKLYNAICTTWIDLGKAKKGADAFILDNRIFLNPKSGKPLTNTEWGIIKKDILRTFKYFYTKEEKQIVRYAMALGKVLKGLPLNHALKHGHNTLKNKIVDVMAKLDSPYWHNSITFATQNAGAMIVDLTQRQYKQIHDVIQNSIIQRKTSEELSIDLFDRFGNWNRDWRRIAETEIGNSQNNGQLLTELERKEPDEIIFMQGVSSAGACPWCLNEVDGKIVVLLDTPPSGGDSIKIKGETYTAIWPGKSNYGRSRQNWWVAAGTQHPHTYSKDTDVFTDNGWKRFYKLNKTDKIMAIDPETCETRFVKYTQIVKHYQDNMIRLSGRNFDLMVTPEHRQLRLSRKTGKFIESSVNELIQLHNFSLPRAIGKWIQGKYIVRNGLSEEQFARLWAWFLSDGCTSIVGNSIQVQIPQKNNLAIQKDLKGLISPSGCVSTVVKQMFASYAGVKAWDKWIPSEVKNLSVDGLRAFLDSYSHADGHNRKGKSGHSSSYSLVRGESVVLYTTSLRLMNDLSEIIVKAGYLPSFSIQKPTNKLIQFPNGAYKTKRIVYIISICKAKYRRFVRSMGVGKIENVIYNDIAYDVTLEKWHHLLVRRNGKVAWSGNCRCTWARYEPELGNWYAKIRESVDQIAQV